MLEGIFTQQKKKKKQSQLAYKLELHSGTIIGRIATILEQMGLEGRTDYDELINKVFGYGITDIYRRYYLRGMLGRYLNYIRRRYSIHIYQVYDKDSDSVCLKILNSKAEFTQVMDMTRRRVEQYKATLKKLDLDSTNSTYRADVAERIRTMKDKEKPKGG